MEVRDLVVSPIVFLLILWVAYLARPSMAPGETARYFYPALMVKLLGALALGVTYQFYYNGGDTFNFHTHGSRHVWEAFFDSPLTGLKLLFADGNNSQGIYAYSSKIPFFRDPTSYTVIRIASVIDLITFSSYSATAMFFGVFSFIGSWLLFLTFYRKYPHLGYGIALATLFIPSVIFWGSGIMKDTVVFSCLGVATYEIDRLFNQRRISFMHVVWLLLACYLIFLTKKFILQAFVPCAILWVYLENLSTIRSVVARMVVLPFLIVIILIGGFFAAFKIGEGDSRYAITELARTSTITATDIRYQTGRFAGSGYSLGRLDGSYETMLRLAPQAINVSLFRPYPWEVKNPLMLLTSLESLGFLLACVAIPFFRFRGLLERLTNPDILFCAAFVLIFAFAVGISTYNFGTLARYKIPLLPFFALGIVIIYGRKSERKFPELEVVE